MAKPVDNPHALGAFLLWVVESGRGSQLEGLVVRLSSYMRDTGRENLMSFSGAQEGCPNKKPQLPIHTSCTNQDIFVRLICNPVAHANEPYFQWWIPHIARWIQENKSIYFFIHCPQERFSPHFARIFQQLLEEAGLDIPPLPWNTIPKWGLFD